DGRGPAPCWRRRGTTASMRSAAWRSWSGWRWRSGAAPCGTGPTTPQRCWWPRRSSGSAGARPPPTTTPCWTGRGAPRRPASAGPGVREVETLRVRKVGLEYLVDIHIEVDPGLTVEAGHAIAHTVKDRVIGHVAAIRDVLVHVEPHETLAGTTGRP